MSTLDPRIVKEVHGNIIKIFLHFFGMKDMEDYLKFKPCGYNEKFQPCNYAEFVKKVKKIREEKGSDITSDDLTDLHYSIEKRIEQAFSCCRVNFIQDRAFFVSGTDAKEQKDN